MCGNLGRFFTPCAFDSMAASAGLRSGQLTRGALDEVELKLKSEDYSPADVEALLE